MGELLVDMLPLGLKIRSAATRTYCVGARHYEDLFLFLENIQCLSGFRSNHQVLSAVLKSCATLSAIKFGKTLHGYIVKQGHLTCHAVSKALLNMYAKCGVLDDCQRLFSQIGNSDPVTWNIVLSGLSGSRMDDVEVMRLYDVMHKGGKAKPSSITIATILPVCARLLDINMGKCVHSYVIKSGLDMDTLVGNALISMYAKCGLVCDDAFAVFNSMNDKDVVSWNAIIAGFAENKFTGNAFKWFQCMLKGLVEPNYATIANILPVCASLNETAPYYLGREIHCYVQRRTELILDVSVRNALVSFYLRGGWMKEAVFLFRSMTSRDLVSWNAIIAGYASNGEWLKALDLFLELLFVERIQPDSITFVSILPACAFFQNLLVGKQIHGYIIHHPYLCEDTAVGNALISFYAKCYDIEAAFQTFFMILERDLISWNSILKAFVDGGYDTKFLGLLNWMLSEGIRPDSITILTILQFCAKVLRVEKVKETHSYSMRTGLLQGDIEPTVGNALLDTYAKCGNIEYAFRIFQSFSGKRNLVTYNAMISGYVNCRSHDDAYKIFDRMSETDLTTWNLMVRVYAENDCPGEALNLLQELQARGMKPDTMTIMSFLPVCAQMASVHQLNQCHGYALRAGFEDVRLKGALLDVYAKCGAIKSAYKLFHSSTHKDLVMFTAMVSGYAMHGMGEEALSVFSYMLELGVKPDHVIITAVLSACSHSGLVSEGLKVFYSIEKVHGFKPTMEQYACMVDLLARGGRVNDAYSFVVKMPIEANANVWGTLLGACRTHHEVELGRLVADRLFEIEANNIGNYVVMSNLYAADARWDGVIEVRKLMRTRDLKKPAGCSWIEVERRKNVFVAGDCTHSQRGLIYSTLSTLDQQIKEPVRL